MSNIWDVSRIVDEVVDSCQVFKPDAVAAEAVLFQSLFLGESDMVTKDDRISIGQDRAIKLAATKWWRECSLEEIAKFQLLTVELTCPFTVFHEAVEKTLNRPVFTHEFGVNYDGILNEVFNDGDAPTFQDIMELIPKDKRILFCIDDQ